MTPKHTPTFWMTGLSAAGKSTAAVALETALRAQGRCCQILDGDEIRRGLNRDLGYSAADRRENLRRIAEVARLLNDAGFIVIVSCISPFAADRAMACEIVGPTRFIEVYIDAPLAVCEARDPKGLYRKARSGLIAEFTGISSAYEAPVCPHVIIDTTQVGPEAAAMQLLMQVTETNKPPHTR